MQVLFEHMQALSTQVLFETTARRGLASLTGFTSCSQIKISVNRIYLVATRLFFKRLKKWHDQSG